MIPVNRVMRVAFINLKNRMFIEYLVDTESYKEAEEIARRQANQDSVDFNVYDVVSIADVPILKGA